jgi:hypothetical protein
MTPVEELFEKLWNTDKDKLTWHSIFNEALNKELTALDESYELGWKHGAESVKRNRKRKEEINFIMMNQKKTNKQIKDNGLFDLEEFLGYPRYVACEYFENKGWEYFPVWNDNNMVLNNHELNVHIIAKSEVIDDEKYRFERIIDIGLHKGVRKKEDKFTDDYDIEKFTKKLDEEIRKSFDKDGI